MLLGSFALTRRSGLCLALTAPRVGSNPLVSSDRGKQQPDRSQQWMGGERDSLDHTEQSRVQPSTPICSVFSSYQTDATCAETAHAHRHIPNRRASPPLLSFICCLLGHLEPAAWTLNNTVKSLKLHVCILEGFRLIMCLTEQRFN